MQLLSCEEEKMMKTFNEVSKESVGSLWHAADYVEVSSVFLLGDMVEEEVDEVQVKQIKDLKKLTLLDSETIGQKVEVICDLFQVNNDSESLQHLVDAAKSDVEVERVLAMKLEEAVDHLPGQ